MTHDSTGAKATQDRRRSRTGVWTAVAVITLGVAGAITATVVDHQHDQANTDAAEQSAWENRESLEALVGDPLEQNRHHRPHRLDSDRAPSSGLRSTAIHRLRVG